MRAPVLAQRPRPLIPLRALIPAAAVIVCAVIGPLLPDHHRADPCAALGTDDNQFRCWIEQMRGRP